MPKTRVLLADDHALFREGLAIIVGSQPDMEVIGEAGDGLEAVVKAGELKPDLVLMDIRMPGCDGLEATRRIKAALPDTTIVILTMRDDDERLFQAIRNGAQGYLLKSIHSSDMVALLRDALQGEAVFSPGFAGRILAEFRRLSQAPQPAGPAGAELLTAREQEILVEVARGLTDKEIADKFTLSLYTVKSHLRNILAKMHVNSRKEAAQLGREQGLI